MTHLDQTIKEQHVEMEQRIKKLDNNVRKNEAEVQERTRQVIMSSGVRSAMHATSQLSGKGPTDVDDAPTPAH